MNKYLKALQEYTAAKKDMSYCKCGKPNQVGGFSCKQHCKHGKAEGNECPPATKDVDLNTNNRNATIKNHMYGPLNVDVPGDYWKKIAEKWDTTEEAAKKSLCGNCVAFDISPKMNKCMPGEVSDESGRLGYCWMHHFKCHSARTCDTWAKGGPIKTDEVSDNWSKKSGIIKE